jgi:hypothetical protein
MGRHSWHWVVQGLDENWEYLLAELFLEFLGHIVTNLTNAVEGSKSDLGIWVLQVSEHDWDHSRNVLDIVDVFTNLGESHQSSILVSPIRFVVDRIVNNRTEEWKALLLTNS